MRLRPSIFFVCSVLLLINTLSCSHIRQIQAKRKQERLTQKIRQTLDQNQLWKVHILYGSRTEMIIGSIHSISTDTNKVLIKPVELELKSYIIEKSSIIQLESVDKPDKKQAFWVILTTSLLVYFIIEVSRAAGLAR